jgi:transcriptional regulator GlxA family with amidase domain
MDNKRNVAVLVFDQVEVLDFAGPFEVFSRTRLTPGIDSRKTDESLPFDVFTIAEQRESVFTVGGMEVVPKYDFASAPPINVLVVPGGWGTRALLDKPSVTSWIKRTAAAATVTCSVCTGALLLAQAGLLRNRRATTHWGAYDELDEIDPSIDIKRGARLVHDTIITSAGIAAGLDMALSVVDILHGIHVAEDTAKYMEYRREVVGL